MSEITTYKMGAWSSSSLKDLGLKEYGDSEDRKVFFEKNGFWTFPCLEMGDYPYNGYIMHSHQHKKIWFVDVSIGEDVNEFIILDFPSLMFFLKEMKDVFPKKTELENYIKECDSDRYIKKNKIDSVRIICNKNVEKNRSYTIYAYVGDDCYTLADKESEFSRGLIVGSLGIY